jgi:hypothetical protein
MDSRGRWSDVEGFKGETSVEYCSYGLHERSKQRGGLDSEEI